MGRKRLLTILATVAAAVTLQVAPAAAQLSVPGVGDVNVGSDECLEVGVDISLSDALKLDPSVCISEDGVEVDGGAKALQDKVEADAGTATKPVQESTKKVAEATKKATGSAGGDSADSGSSSGSTDGSGSESADGGSSDAPSSGDSGSNAGVAASGNAPEPLTSSAGSASRQAQLGALMAIRNELAAGSPGERGVAGPVQTFGGLGTTGDLAAPQVADAADVTAGVDGPQVAPSSSSDQDEPAIFASSDPMRDLAEAPLALQLLAAALVLGAAAVWTIAAREYGGKEQTTSA